MYHLWIKCLAAWIFLKRFNGVHVMQAKAPMFPNEPFLVFWNAPTTQCRLRYKVDLDLKTFHIVPNANESLSGSAVTIFYPTHLGVYPHIDDRGHFFNGIIPQNESLVKHLNKSKSDINRMIPLRTFHGLGVIDWENWRPQWDRNWGSKNVYRNRSIQFARDLHPELSEDEIKRLAKREYEKAAKSFMRDTLLLAEEMRPDGYWGYYLYPDCQNYNYKTKTDQYTGECPDIEMSRNDQLLWLWRDSTALFPNIYLETILRSSDNALKFVHHRLKEAMRIASMARKDYALPVFVYARPFYAYTFEPLTQEDLVTTVGETAAMGAAGIVFWGSMQYASTVESCGKVKDYMNGPLGRYIVNVTTAAKICSRFLCKRHGRCVRKHSDSNAFLHLFPDSFRIMVHGNATEKKVDITMRMLSCKHPTDEALDLIVKPTVTGHKERRIFTLQSPHPTSLETVQKNIMIMLGLYILSPKESCGKVKDYMNGPLGRYIVNVTTAAKICSRFLCKRHGRCVRKHSDSNAFLHLFPDSFRIMVHGNATEKKVIVKGKLELENLIFLRNNFMCQCYQGWKGLYCEKHSIKEIRKI